MNRLTLLIRVWSDEAIPKTQLLVNTFYLVVKSLNNELAFTGINYYDKLCKKKTVQYQISKSFLLEEGKMLFKEEKKTCFTELKSGFIIDFDMNMVTLK